jgi:hypothetical protein
MKEVFKCRDWRMMRWVEECTKAQAWGWPHTPRNIQEVQASKLGDDPEAPLLHRQKLGHHSTHYIFIASCTMHISWSVSCFSFRFCLVLFAVINGWTPTNSFWRSCLAFHLPRTLHFSLLSFNKCSPFLELHLAFIFHLDLCSDLVIYLHQGVFWPLVHVGIHQRSCFKKVRMVLEKRKSFIQKSGTKGACVDCSLGFCMSCLMSFW